MEYGKPTSYPDATNDHNPADQVLTEVSLLCFNTETCAHTEKSGHGHPIVQLQVTFISAPSFHYIQNILPFLDAGKKW